MSAVRELATDVAGRRSTVMILGETGTGKEVIGRYVHAMSQRTKGLFVPVDCTALSHGLFESEMFGHVRGAFTGAIRDSVGIIRSADGGTLFLDEIGELQLAQQAKLLRVLQERRVTPVGAQRSIPVDVRFLCATHRDLPAMVRAGTFREDLYYRLNVVMLYVPPLRARLEDVISLANHFLRLHADIYEEPVKTISDEAAAILTAYHWPGNVRELANVIEHAHVLSRGPVILATDLPLQIRASATATASPVLHEDVHLLSVERKAIAEALRRCRNNKAAASRMLGINIQRLTRRMRRLGVNQSA